MLIQMTLGEFKVSFKFCVADYKLALLTIFTGFFYLFKDIADENITTFRTPEGTIMQLIQMTLGEFKVSFNHDNRLGRHGTESPFL